MYHMHNKDETAADGCHTLPEYKTGVHAYDVVSPHLVTAQKIYKNDEKEINSPFPYASCFPIIKTTCLSFEYNINCLSCIRFQASSHTEEMRIL